jgi:pimeloyl-ACP methyl ester carboxylesterase
VGGVIDTRSATSAPSVGHRLRSVTIGEGPAVVLLSGTGMAVTEWWSAVRPTSIGCRALAVEWIDSPQPVVPYRVEDLADDVADLIDGTGIDAGAVVGISLGGFVAMELARKRPDLVGQLVLLACLGRPAPIVLSAARDLAAGASAPRVDGRRAQQIASAAWMVDPALEDRWPALDVPAIAVAFGRDPLFPPAEVEAASARLPRATYVEIAGARHNGLATHAAEIGHLVADFALARSGADPCRRGGSTWLS